MAHEMSSTSSSSFNPSPSPARPTGESTNPGPGPATATTTSSSIPGHPPTGPITRTAATTTTTTTAATIASAAPPDLRTGGGLPTRMPERDREWLLSVKEVSEEAKRRTGEVHAKWAACVAKFWELAKARAQSGNSEEGKRDVRDFCAVATRIFDPHHLELSLAVAYADMPAKIDRLEKKMLKATIDSTRRAVENSLRAPAGADKNQEFSKWRLYWWFGEDICTNVSKLQTISAALNASTKTNKVSFEELTDRLWRKVFAKRGDADSFPSPTSKDLGEVYGELVEEKSRADEFARERREQLVERRAAIERERDVRRRAAVQQEQAQGQEKDTTVAGPDRKRDRDNLDDLDDEELYGASPRAHKRARIDPDQSAIDEQLVIDQQLGGFETELEPEPEVGRRASAAASSFSLDQMADEIRPAPDSVASIQAWLARARRIARDLAPPDDPEEILDNDVKTLLQSIQLSLGVVTGMMQRAAERHG